MAVITISRQFGSGGWEVAVRVCELLGYRYFAKRLTWRILALRDDYRDTPNDLFA